MAIDVEGHADLTEHLGVDNRGKSDARILRKLGGNSGSLVRGQRFDQRGGITSGGVFSLGGGSRTCLSDRGLSFIRGGIRLESGNILFAEKSADEFRLAVGQVFVLEALVHQASAAFAPPKEQLEEVFRGKFVDGLKRAYHRRKPSFGGATASLSKPKAFAAFLRTLHRRRWVAYVKHAMAAPASVLRYLGRYTHRVAISNHRLVSVDGEQVTFRWKDYPRGNKQRLTTLTASEFLRRYAQHILPHGFVRIRQFGFLANRYRSTSLALIRTCLIGGSTQPPRPIPSTAAWQCPRCGNMMHVGSRLTAQQLRAQCPYPDTS